MKKLIFVFGIFMLAFISFDTVKAVEVDEKIKSFETKVVISKDNKANITETIVYDLGVTPHHGIYRDIPIDYVDGNNKYYLTSDYQTTSDENGNQVQSQISEKNGNQRIRLGDPDKTTTGVHTYKIKYSLRPIVYKKDGKPFFNFDVVGTGWPVPIEKATASVSLEDGSAFTQPQCFYGFQGMKNTCQSVPRNSNEKLIFETTNLNAYQGMTINAYVPDGYVSEYLVPNKQRPIDWWAVFGALAIPSLVFVGFFIACLVFFLRWYRAYKKRKRQTVVAQYDPPATLSPAEIGHLEDDSSSMAEITATIVDLAVKGFLKISQAKKTGLGGIFGGNEYTLTSLGKNGQLTGTDQIIFGALFAKGKVVKLNDLDKTAMSTAITSFKSEVKSSLQTKGFYDSKGGILQKGNLTDEGAKQWSLVDGFKLYIKVVEKDRLKFTDAPQKTPERFSMLLPYAIALGVEKQWAKQFEGIDITQSTNNWYHGNNMVLFSAASLTSDLNSGFSSAVSSNTSVSSSGGSSGGGFGGGGGGSW